MDDTRDALAAHLLTEHQAKVGSDAVIEALHSAHRVAHVRGYHHGTQERIEHEHADDGSVVQRQETRR